MGFFRNLFQGPQVDQSKATPTPAGCASCLTVWWKTAAATG